MVSESKKAANEKWDRENMSYQTIKVRKELLEEFKACCAANGDKVNTVLRQAMESYIDGRRGAPAPDIGPVPDYDGIGIYCIRNKGNGRVYVGSSRNVKRRTAEHRRAMLAGTCNKKLLEDIKAGDAFVFDVLETIPAGCTIAELIEKEREWVRELDAYPGGYNSPVANITTPGRGETKIE